MLYFFWFQLGQDLVVNSSNCSSLFIFCRAELITPIRYSSVDTQPIYTMNCLEQEFCVLRISDEVNGGSSFLLLQDSKTPGHWCF